MNELMVKAINEQIKYEFESAYLYLAMSVAMKDNFYNGYGNWLQKQYQEELEHAHKFISFLQERGEKVELSTINIEPWAGNDPLEIAKESLAHEKFVTSKINDLYEMALNQKDWATKEFLGWYVTEQVEEEANASDIVEMFTIAAGNRATEMLVDSKLGARQ